MQKQKPLKCRKCGHIIGTVRVKPAFMWKLLLVGAAITFGLELSANITMKLIGF